MECQRVTSCSQLECSIMFDFWKRYVMIFKESTKGEGERAATVFPPVWKG